MFFIGSIVCMPIDELRHYGIKGQKWGVRRGPPYPLEADDFRSRMRKRNKPDYNYRTPVGRDVLKRYPAEKISSLKRLEHPLREEDLRRINHPKNSEPGHAYNCPKCAAAFEMMCRGYDVQANPAQHGSNVGDIERFFKNGKLECMNKDAEFPKRPNCPFPYGKSLIPRKVREKIWDDYDKKVDKVYEDTTRRTEEYILHQGENARGIIVVGWADSFDFTSKATSFHAFNYRVEQGKIVWYDTQSWGKSTGFRETSSFMDNVDPRDVYIMRTDNLDLSERITSAVHSSRG